MAYILYRRRRPRRLDKSRCPLFSLQPAKTVLPKEPTSNAHLQSSEEISAFCEIAMMAAIHDEGFAGLNHHLSEYYETQE